MRETNILCMKAIIKHNIFKQLKRLTKYDKQDINNFIDSLSLDELKQKGLTKQIVLQFKNGKPRNVLSGEGKRKRDDDDNQAPDQKISRGPVTKVLGYFVGNPIDDDEYTIKVKRDKMKEILKEEQEAKREYELAQSRTKKAIHDEEMALMELQLIEKSKVPTGPKQ